MKSAEEITLKIDNRTVKVAAGTTVLEAARQAGVLIPTMCHRNMLPPAEACRMCIVEVKGEAKPLAACATAARPAMEVVSVSPALKAERETIFRLMLEDHYGDCLPPCTLRCPTNIDIQGYIALIAMGRYLEAARLILRNNPLPMSCGRVCPHPCEANCRRNRVDQPVNINHLKRFCSDFAYQNIVDLGIQPEAATGKKVAIVGGGPAGLSASFYLALAGHEPTIFEAYPQLGGMLRYGIPEYRLPKKTLDREIQAILSAGVKVKTGQVWSRDFTLADLKAQGFDAIFLGIGAAINRELEFVPPGTQGIQYGTIFLSQVALGQVTSIGKRLAVIGGGNTAMDCARTSLRLGAEQVTIFYRRSRKEMPAQAIEVDETELEGVKLELCVAPIAMQGHDNRLTGLKFVRMDLCGVDESGRAKPMPIAGSEFTVELDTVIMAVGQVADGPVLQKDSIAKTLKFGRDNTVSGDPMTGRTNLEGIFTGGDLMSGPATVVEAIGGGRRAAQAIDRFLKGQPVAALRPFLFSKGAKLPEVDQSNFDNRPKIPREHMPMLEPLERENNFKEVELGLSQEQARAEALRCLSCGCQAVEGCRIRQTAHDLGLRELVIRPTPSTPFKIIEQHPYIAVENGKCIVCRTCERACEHYHGRKAVQVELERVGALDQYRSHGVVFNEHCDNCGLCAALCPTGALSYKTPWPKPGPFPLAWNESICNLCSLGCRIQAGHIGQKLTAMEGAVHPPAYGHLCVRGRFELVAGRDSRERITRPLVRKEGKLVETGWDEAIQVLVKGFTDIKKNSGSQALAGLSLGQGTLEELYLFGKVVRTGFSTNHLDVMTPAGTEALRDLALPLAYSEIELQDLVVVVGSELSQVMPLLEAALHRMVAKGGKLVLIGQDRNLALRAALHLNQAPNQALDLLVGLMKDRKAEPELNKLFQTAEKIMVILGGEVAGKEILSGLLATKDSAKGKRIQFGFIPAVSSGAALGAAGLVAAQEIRFNNSPILEAAQQGKIKGLFFQAGHNPAKEHLSERIVSTLQEVEFLAAIALYDEPLLDQAQVVLPALFSFENEGTYIAADGNKCVVVPALMPPQGILPTWQVLGRILQGLTGHVEYKDLQQVRAELS
jgi:formate dehydrogenase major subunit